MRCAADEVGASDEKERIATLTREILHWKGFCVGPMLVVSGRATGNLMAEFGPLADRVHLTYGQVTGLSPPMLTGQVNYTCLSANDVII